MKNLLLVTSICSIVATAQGIATVETSQTTTTVKRNNHKEDVSGLGKQRKLNKSIFAFGKSDVPDGDQEILDGDGSSALVDVLPPRAESTLETPSKDVVNIESRNSIPADSIKSVLKVLPKSNEDAYGELMVVEQGMVGPNMMISIFNFKQEQKYESQAFAYLTKDLMENLDSKTNVKNEFAFIKGGIFFQGEVVSIHLSGKMVSKPKTFEMFGNKFYPEEFRYLKNVKSISDEKNYVAFFSDRGVIIYLVNQPKQEIIRLESL